MHVRVKCKKSLLYYFKNNIHITTSGHYSDEALKMCMDVYILRLEFSNLVGWVLIELSTV
jgi:hypothetical protein